MEKTVCNKCKQEVPTSEIVWKNKTKGIKSKRCKACVRETSRKHYQANKEKYLVRNKRTRKLALEYIKKAKEVPCADCGKSYPSYVMDFDHVAGEKKYNIARMPTENRTIPTLKREIAKCEVVCANCHRIRTHG